MNLGNISKDISDLLLRSLVGAEEEWPWLDSKINALVINTLVNVCRHRPHPWSTVSDYVSWTSLTDQRWSARHLPAKYRDDLPLTENLVAMFQRPAGEQRLCPKSTCLFPAFAQYLTDGFIRTRMQKKGEDSTVRRQNTSNHQIDLCPLYGRLPVQTDALRLKSEVLGERGRLKSQFVGDEEYAPFLYQDGGPTKPEFEILDPPLGVADLDDPDATPRDLGLRKYIFAFGGDRVNGSPQVSMMNTLFLREHNRLAGLMEATYTGWDDERVFQTARNTLIALFIKIVVEEYINHISPTPFRMRADPSVAWDAPWNKPNWMTTEFSLLYRWHSLIPDTMQWHGNDLPVAKIILNNEPLLAGGLARAFTDLSAQRAAQLGAFNTADALLGLEKLAIDQGRMVHLAPYTDYRAYVKLSRPHDFSDISENAQVVDFLRDVYQNDVSKVDFYAGLFAEDVGPNSPLPPLLQSMVAVDAFSQALTNPLLSKYVFNPDTFSTVGWDAINNTSKLSDVVQRNTTDAIDPDAIGMTVQGWKYSWL